MLHKPNEKKPAKRAAAPKPAAAKPAGASNSKKQSNAEGEGGRGKKSPDVPAVRKISAKPASKPIPAAGRSSDQPLDLSHLASFAGYRLRRAQISVFDDFIAEASALDLRPAQFSALVVIDANPGSKQSEIAHALGIKSTNFVAMVNELEARGLVERRASDRRSYALHLTAAGQQLLGEMERRHAKVERRYDALLGPDGRETLYVLLDKLCEGKS